MTVGRNKKLTQKIAQRTYTYIKDNWASTFGSASGRYYQVTRATIIIFSSSYENHESISQSAGVRNSNNFAAVTKSPPPPFQITLTGTAFCLHRLFLLFAKQKATKRVGGGVQSKIKMNQQKTPRITNLFFRENSILICLSFL